MKKIFLLAIDNTSVAGLSGALEIFNVANVLSNIQNPGDSPAFQCSVVTSETNQLELCRGLRVDLGMGIHPYEQADAIVTTGFLYQSIDHLVEKIDHSKRAINWIRKQYEYGAIIGASCSGTVLLAETGLLDGKTATTSWWLNNFFKKRYPKIELQIERLLVTNNRLYTGGSVTSYLNLVLGLIEKFAGKDLALSCSKMMLIDINRFSQAPFVMLQSILDHSDDIVIKAQYWINEHLQEKIDLRKLAKYCGITYRTLIRRFKSATDETPTLYIQKSRIEAAKRLLETTDLNLDSIMDRVGYFDPSSFSLLFKRLTQLTPREYRLRFSMNNRQAS
ncbi:helix-turn-helix domain-containing protein [bacterium]|nr:helix-turn-helix domain-containing protein [bacterium]